MFNINEKSLLTKARLQLFFSKFLSISKFNTKALEKQASVKTTFLKTDLKKHN